MISGWALVGLWLFWHVLHEVTQRLLERSWRISNRHTYRAGYWAGRIAEQQSAPLPETEQDWKGVRAQYQAGAE